MTPEEFRALGKLIWRTYVPKSGQASTVQGELLRANEKLRDESHRNGNLNWDDGFEVLALYILDTLTASPDVSDGAKAQLRLDVERVLDFERPNTEDDLFDRIERAILDWCARNEVAVPRTPNPLLHR